jgi:uncharacterized protein
MKITKKRVFITLGVIAALISIGLYVLVEHILPYSGIKPNRIVVSKLPEFSQGALPSDNGLPDYEHLTVKAQDGIDLDAYLIKADSPICTIVLLHGIGDCKEHFYGFCKQLKDLHCNTLIMDNRAHGASGGEYCTFGYYEKYDVQAVLDYAESRQLAKPYGIYGHSLGGAIALQTLGISDKLDFGIIESTFDRLDKVFVEYGEDMVGLRWTWLSNHVLHKSGQIAHFDPMQVSPSESCKQIKCPMLMAHGTADDKIPISFGMNNFANLASTEKNFLTVQGAGHNDLQRVAGRDYQYALELFIRKSVEIYNVQHAIR